MRSSEFTFKKTKVRKFHGICLDLTVAEAVYVLDVLESGTRDATDEELSDCSQAEHAMGEICGALREFVEKHQ